MFIDGDGDSFEHLLRYLRLKTKPLFWDHATGFDIQKYNALQVTADYFGVTDLSEWIKAKMYLKVVTIRTWSHRDNSISVEPHGYNTRVSFFPQSRL